MAQRPVRATRELHGHGDHPLDELVRQLWLPAVRTGRIRVVLAPRPDIGWRTVERYAAVPNLHRPRLLVPAGPTAVTTSALLAYRGMRPVGTQLVRTGYGALARAGLMARSTALAVQACTGEPAPDLPLRAITRELGYQRLRSAIGVLGRNRKVTLQLFADDGRPAGYAKTSWNTATAALVSTETAALREVARRSGRIRVPAPIGTGSWAGQPFLVTAPLPGAVRALGSHGPIPSPEAVSDLMPLRRRGEIVTTAHAAAVRRRLDALPRDGRTESLRRAVDDLWGALTERRATAGIATRWHGDFVPWNLAREGTEQLWCWDWESSEADAVAGLDAVHWHVSVHRDAATGPAPHLLGGLAAAQDHLRAAGTPQESWPDVAALYAVALTERVWSYAVGSDGWSEGSITPAQLVELLGAARAQLR